MADVTILDLPLKTDFDETDFLHIVDNLSNIDERTTILLLAQWILESAEPTKFTIDLTNTRLGLNNDTPLYTFDAKATVPNMPLLYLSHLNGNKMFSVGDDSGQDTFVDLNNAAGGSIVRLHSDGDSYITGGNLSIGSSLTPVNKLQINTNVADDGLSIIADNVAQYPLVKFNSDRPATADILNKIVSEWNGNSVACINTVAGSDSINKDNASISILTSESGTLVERMNIGEDGLVHLPGENGAPSEYRLSRLDTEILNDYEIGKINFTAPNEVSGATGIGAEIVAFADGDLDDPDPTLGLILRTFKAGVGLRDSLTIDSDGNINFIGYGEGVLRTDPVGNVASEPNGGFESGVVLAGFGQPSAPLGWTKKLDWADNAMLTLNSEANGTALSSGGSANPQDPHLHTTGSHALSIAQLAQHRHSIAGITSVQPAGTAAADTKNTSNTAMNTGYQGSSLTHNHGDTGNNTAPIFQEVISCIKD